MSLLWEKLERGRALATSADEAAQTNVVKKEKQSRQARKRRRILCDVIGTIFWSYLVVKVFIGDLDLAVSKGVPFLEAVFRYRFLLLVGALVVLAGVARRTTLLWILYILGFPLVVLFWKLPKFYIKHKSWALVLGTAHILSTVLQTIKFGIISIGLFVLAAAAIVLMTPAWLQATAAIILLTLWVITVVRAFVYAVRPSRFVVGQRKLADTILKSSWARDNYGIPPVAKDPAIPDLTEEQTNDVLGKVSSGLILHRGLALLTYRLDLYRQTGAFIIFSAISIVALLLQALLTFSLINYAVFQLDSSQYNFDRDPNLLTFFYYSSASMFNSEVGVVQPEGTFALLVALAAWLSTGFLVLVLVVAIIFGIKNSKTDDTAKRAIADLEAGGNHLEVVLRDEYELSLTEVSERLSAMQWGTAGMIAWMASQVPAPPPDAREIQPLRVGAGARCLAIRLRRLS